MAQVKCEGVFKRLILRRRLDLIEGRLNRRLVRAGQFDLHDIADSQYTALIMQGILAEIDLVFPFPDAVKCCKRFFACLRGFRVYGWHSAAGARLGKPEVDSANADFAPTVFGVTGATANDQVGPKAGHR